jgi:hypothetical protein
VTIALQLDPEIATPNPIRPRWSGQKVDQPKAFSGSAFCRRLLFSFIVGATSCGVVGWSFRPTPNWTLNLGPNRSAAFVQGRGSQTTTNPVWLLVEDLAPSNGNEWYCVDSATGDVLNRFQISKSANTSASVLDDGRLVVVDSPPRSVGPNTETIINLFDHRCQQPLFSRSLKGEWRVTRSGQFAWQTTQMRDSLVLTVVEPRTGETIFKREFHGGEYRDRDCIFHDSGFAAIEVGSAGSPSEPEGVEVWDLKANQRAASAVFPTSIGWGGDVYISEPWFSDSGEVVESFVWSKDSRSRLVRILTLDVASGRFSENACKPLVEPPNTGRGTFVEFAPRADGFEVWVSERFEPFSVWFCIQRNGLMVAPWKESPFSSKSERRIVAARRESAYAPSNRPLFGTEGRLLGVRTTTAVDLLKAPESLLVQTAETSCWSLLPRTIRNLTPWSWQASDTSVHFRWHHCKSGDWRDIGCDSSTTSTSLHGNALLSISRLTLEDTQVHSWPLPPTDPCRPALTAFVIGACAVWVICASRRRNRTELPQSVAF